MVNSQEIVERTFYICLLKALLEKKRGLNPEDYLPLSPENEERFQKDKDSLDKFIYLFGIGNNQVRGPKNCPRITIESTAYYPGDIGVEKYIIGDKLDAGNYQMSEFPYETKDITIDIHLVATTQNDMRLLHSILHEALPTRGYIRPYFNDLEEWDKGKIAPTGNLFIEISNFYDHPDESQGLLEKVYQYVCKDGIIPEKLVETGDLIPIKDISLLLGPEYQKDEEMLNLNIHV